MVDVFTPNERSVIMRSVRVKNTEPELLIRSMLRSMGYRFQGHHKDLPGTPDIVLPRRQIVIFVHGCFWHGHSCARGALPSSNTGFWKTKIDKNRKRDARTRRQLNRLGWKVINIWQCELRKKHKLHSRLLRILGQADNKRLLQRARNSA
jgi:DNA mismatch endonuclease, patch repair protein